MTGEGEGGEAPLRFHDNDRWRGEVAIGRQAPHEFTIIAWRDLFATWQDEVRRKCEAGQGVASEVKEGAHLLEQAAEGARASQSGGDLAGLLAEIAAAEEEARLALLRSERAAALYRQGGPRSNVTRYEKVLPVRVDRPKAAFSAWYELLPRSQSGDAARHGTFDDVIRRLPYVRDLGFDVLYLPPIHPIRSEG